MMANKISDEQYEAVGACMMGYTDIINSGNTPPPVEDYIKQNCTDDPVVKKLALEGINSAIWLFNLQANLPKVEEAV